MLAGALLSCRRAGQTAAAYVLHTTDDDYTMGTAEEKITRVIKRAAAVHGVQVVVLYLNCLDILTRLDFDYLESSLSEATGVMVRYFFRGPLGKMDIRHFKPVYEFMAELPEENGCISHNLYQLPPLATDVAGVIDTLPDTDEAKVLAAPSGLHRRSTLENARNFFFCSPHRIIISRRPAKHKLLQLALRRRTKI